MKTITLVEATKENVKTAIDKIVKFADEKGYQIKGDLEHKTSLIRGLFGSGLKFDSKRQEKKLKHYLTWIDISDEIGSRKMSMKLSNRFLHFLYKGIYKKDGNIPYVEYSDVELKIKDSRKIWKKAALEAEKLRLEYVANKGDFYKKK